MSSHKLETNSRSFCLCEFVCLCMPNENVSHIDIWVSILGTKLTLTESLIIYWVEEMSHSREDLCGRSSQRAELKTDTPWYPLFYLIALLGTRRPEHVEPWHFLSCNREFNIGKLLCERSCLCKWRNKAQNNFSRYRVYKVPETIPLYGVFCLR